MQQRLYLVQTATADANGVASFTFDAPPQGTAWTGSVSVYAAPHVPTGVTPPSLEFGDLQGSMWWLTRNGLPILQMSGGATAADVQCVGQEVLGITGQGVPPATPLTAVWSGWSDDLSVAALCEPHPYGVTPPYMQVSNTTRLNQPAGPLMVTQVPPTNRQIACVSAASAGPSTTTVILPASANRYFQLHGASLQLCTAQPGTTSQDNPCLASLVTDDGVTQTPLLECETLVIQDSSQTTSVSLDLQGLSVAPNQAVSLVTGTLPAGALRARCSVVYSYIPIAP